MTALAAFLNATTTWTRALTLVTIGFGIQQLTVGHNIDPQTALTILFAGLASRPRAEERRRLRQSRFWSSLRFACPHRAASWAYLCPIGDGRIGKASEP